EGIPVVWISTLEEVPPRLVTGIDHHVPATSGADCTKGPLLDVLLPIFSAPPALPGSGRRKSGRARLERFVGERWHPRCYLAVYDILKNIVRGRRPRFVINSRTIEERCQDWDRFLDQAPVTGDPTHPNHRGDLRQRLRAVLLERFAWADALA